MQFYYINLLCANDLASLVPVNFNAKEHLSSAIHHGDLFKERRDQRLIQCRSATAATLRPCDDWSPQRNL